MTRKYHNEHAEAVHSAAKGMFRSGSITKERMKEFDDMCLVKEERETPKQMRQARAAVGQKQLEQTA